MANPRQISKYIVFIKIAPEKCGYITTDTWVICGPNATWRTDRTAVATQ